MTGELLQCEICGTLTYAINVHHTSYSPEETISICANCHFIIHHPPQTLEKFCVLSEKLQTYIMMNNDRKEKEAQVEIQARMLARINAEIEIDWKMRLKMGNPTYETAVAKTREEKRKYAELGYDVVDNSDGICIFRRPDKKEREHLPFWSFFRSAPLSISGTPVCEVMALRKDLNDCSECINRLSCSIFIENQELKEKIKILLGESEKQSKENINVVSQL